MKTRQSQSKVGYQRRDPISHRKYSFKTSVSRRKRTGKFNYVGKGALRGSGHRAGEKWGSEKGIDPESKVTKYGKNSPSFSEGVYNYKQKAKSQALLNKMK